jgi:hypothetical protein
MPFRVSLVPPDFEMTYGESLIEAVSLARDLAERPIDPVGVGVVEEARPELVVF